MKRSENVTDDANSERNKKKSLKRFDSSPVLLKRAVFPSVILKKKQKPLPSLKHHGAKTKLRTKINALS